MEQSIVVVLSADPIIRRHDFVDHKIMSPFSHQSGLGFYDVFNSRLSLLSRPLLHRSEPVVP